ncbi:MAG: LPXTG cell wall anchor domain-containing protein [Clostridia bacterium]|nr:LPXTG cell wall anchor domain-containing protein [Clostridia bacterium]
MKKTLALLLSAVLMLALVPVVALSASAGEALPLPVPAGEAEVVFVKDGGTGDGSSADNALGSIGAAYNALDLSKDCTIVVCGTLTFPEATVSYGEEYTGSVTFTSKYDGTDYDATILLSAGSTPRFRLWGTTVFEDVTLKMAGNFYMFICQFHDFKIAETVTVIPGSGSQGKTFGNSLDILVGYQSGEGTPVLENEPDTLIEVYAGEKILICEYNRGVTSVWNYTGTHETIIGGTAQVGTYYNTAVQGPGSEVTYGTTILTVQDNAVLSSLTPTMNGVNKMDHFAVNWIGGSIASVPAINGDGETGGLWGKLNAGGKRVVYTNGTALYYSDESAAAENFDTISAVFDAVEPLPPVVVEPDYPARPVLTSDKVFYMSFAGANTNDGLTKTTPKASWGAVNETGIASLLVDGGTVVCVGKSYVGTNYTLPDFDGNTVLFTAVDTDGTSYLGDATSQTGNILGHTGGQPANVYTFTITGNVIFDNIGLLNRNKAAAGDTLTFEVAEGGALAVTDSVVFQNVSGGYAVPKLKVNAGGVAYLDTLGFSSYVGDGTIVLDPSLEAQVTETTFEGFEGTVVYAAAEDDSCKDGHTGDWSYADSWDLENWGYEGRHGHYRYCENCGELEVVVEDCTPGELVREYFENYDPEKETYVKSACYREFIPCTKCGRWIDESVHHATEETVEQKNYYRVWDQEKETYVDSPCYDSQIRCAECGEVLDWNWSVHPNEHFSEEKRYYWKELPGGGYVESECYYTYLSCEDCGREAGYLGDVHKKGETAQETQYREKWDEEKGEYVKTNCYNILTICTECGQELGRSETVHPDGNFEEEKVYFYKNGGMAKSYGYETDCYAIDLICQECGEGVDRLETHHTGTLTPVDHDETLDPSCSFVGLTMTIHYDVCSVCENQDNYDILISVTGDALGHNFVDGVCTRCGSEGAEYTATLTLDKESVRDGETLTATYTLLDAEKKPVAGRKVYAVYPLAAEPTTTFLLKDDEGVTDENGKAVFEIPMIYEEGIASGEKWIFVVNEEANDGGEVNETAAWATFTYVASEIVVDANGVATVPDAVVEIEKNKPVSIDATNKENPSDSVLLDSATVEKIADAKAETEIKLTSATVTVDAAAMTAIDEKSGDKDVSIVVKTVAETTLNEKQKEALKDDATYVVLSVEVLAGDTVISDLGGGKLKIAVPFELPQGVKAEDVKVAYVADDGTVTEMPTTYENGKVTFVTTHNSTYVVMTSAATTPNTGDSTAFLFVGAIAALAAALLVSRKVKKEN